MSKSVNPGTPTIVRNYLMAGFPNPPTRLDDFFGDCVLIFGGSSANGYALAETSDQCQSIFTNANQLIPGGVIIELERIVGLFVAGAAGNLVTVVGTGDVD